MIHQEIANIGRKTSLVRLAEFALFLTETFGFSFPKESLKDLERKMIPVAESFGFQDQNACIDWLMKNPLSREQESLLATHLTIGETYFFRDPQSFHLLESKIIPELMRHRASKNQTLRVWCAACSSGEEPYSIAIMLHELIPNLKEWNIKIIGTDINPKFLQKAQSGIYKDWSFRTTPHPIKEKYFTCFKEGQYSIIPEIRKMVHFDLLNLVKDEYPLASQGTEAVDVILCNNVLIYFSHKQIHKVVHRLSQCLNPKGWLLVSPIEVPFIQEPLLMPLNFFGKTGFKKVEVPFKKEELPLPDSGIYAETLSKPKKSPPTTLPENFKVELPAFLHLPISVLDFSCLGPLPHSESAPSTSATLQKGEPLQHTSPPQKELSQDVQPPQELPLEVLELFNNWKYAEVIAQLEEEFKKINPDDFKNTKEPKFYTKVMLLIRAYANQGKLKEALHWCHIALEAEKLDPLLYYFYATILLEQKQFNEAIKAFKQAIYLDPHFIMAYFALGNLLMTQGDEKEAQKQFRNTLSLVQKLDSGEILKGTEGVTAREMLGIMNLYTPKTSHTERQQHV